MQKLFALVLAVLLLSGCAAAPTETTAGTEPAPSVTTAPTTVPTAPPATAPTTLPTEPVKSYESFFSEEIACPVKDSYGELWLDTQAVYGPNSKESYALVYERTLASLDLPSDNLGRVVLLDKNNKYLRSLSEEKIYEARPANTEYCAAVSEDQSTLWKLPYAEGAAPEALYTDAYHRLSQPAYFENCLFFMASVDENTDGIYRLYVPENRLDLLVKDLPTGDTECVTFSIVSNVAVAWTVTRQITQEEMETHWETPDLMGGKSPQGFFSDVLGQPDVTLAYLEENKYTEELWQYRSALERYLYGQDTDVIHRYYRNFLTGEERECSGCYTWEAGVVSVVYPDGTRRPVEENSNSELWWLDSYYQKK